LVDLEE
jgi:zinc D-Ala-D-Ala dipeptidase